MDRAHAIMARVAGGVLLVFGIGLATLAMWIIGRMVALPAAIPMSNVAVAIVISAISAFCLLVGYRLLLNRPNRYGSLLSPTGWKILAAFFLVLGIALASIAIWRGEYHLSVASLLLGLFAYGCLGAGRAARLRAPSPVFPPETSLLHMIGFAPSGFRWGIEILNDDRTPMEFVVSVLQKIVGLSEAEAVRTMLQIHRTGGVVMARASLDESRRIADAIAAEARTHNHPLTCRAVIHEVTASGG